MSVNITTVFQPTVTITVSDTEYLSLLNQHLVNSVEGGAPVIRPVLSPEIEAELVRQILAFTGRRPVVYIDDYFPPVRNPGVTDDTDALSAAIAASSGKTLALGSNQLRVTRTVELKSSNTTIDARGATINFVDDGTATGVGVFIHDCVNINWIGGNLTQTAASRSGVYGVMRIERVSNSTVDNVTINGGSSTGIFVIGGQYLRFRAPRVSNTKADGIHISRGTTDSVIDSPIITAVGDDGIGIVGVTTEPGNPSVTYPQVRRITINSPIITGMTVVGGGVSFVGVADCVLRGGTIDTVPTGGVKITNDSAAGAALPSSNIIVADTIVRNAQNGYVLGTSSDVQLVNVQGVNNSDSGVSIAGAVRALISSSKFRGNAGFGLFEAAGSTDNTMSTCDVRGNTANAVQRQSIIVRTCFGYPDAG